MFESCDGSDTDMKICGEELKWKEVWPVECIEECCDGLRFG